uniref:No apical meristem-associated C-terminal domain-containing protein n=1 Tax=Chenopodium quinoa TaxID=63459 RepID=A0A803MSA4_CHEQI
MLVRGLLDGGRLWVSWVLFVGGGRLWVAWVLFVGGCRLWVAWVLFVGGDECGRLQRKLELIAGGDGSDGGGKREGGGNVVAKEEEGVAGSFILQSPPATTQPTLHETTTPSDRRRSPISSVRSAAISLHSFDEIRGFICAVDEISGFVCVVHEIRGLFMEAQSNFKDSNDEPFTVPSDKEEEEEGEFEGFVEVENDTTKESESSSIKKSKKLTSEAWDYFDLTTINGSGSSGKRTRDEGDNSSPTTPTSVGVGDERVARAEGIKKAKSRLKGKAPSSQAFKELETFNTRLQLFGESMNVSNEAEMKRLEIQERKEARKQRKIELEQYRINWEQLSRLEQKVNREQWEDEMIVILRNNIQRFNNDA